MSEHRVLSLKSALRLEWRGNDGQNETEQPDHSASLGDSITSSTRIRFSVHATPVVPEFRPDACEGEKEAVVIEPEPHHVLFFGLRVRLGCVFRETVRRDQAAVYSAVRERPVRFETADF